jgi:hypothetical protein
VYFTVAIKVSVASLWNTASDMAKMIGYPVNKLPVEAVRKAEKFLSEVDYTRLQWNDWRNAKQKVSIWWSLASSNRFSESWRRTTKCARFTTSSRASNQTTWSIVLAKEGAAVDGKKQDWDREVGAI